MTEKEPENRVSATGDGDAETVPSIAIVLVQPQLGENIGAAARAMYNFGLTDLRLVAPRDGWPNDRAVAMAAGADVVVENARVFDSVEAAVADVQYLAASTARPRHMVKPVVGPREAAGEMLRRVRGGATVGLLFGAERSGLENDHIAMADVIVQVPTSPLFSSLNLGQAVLLLSYEWFALTQSGDEVAPLDYGDGVLATGEDLAGLFGHLEGELVDAGYFYPPEKQPVMARTIRNALQRAEFSYQEVQILRGVIKALSYGRPPRM